MLVMFFFKVIVTGNPEYLIRLEIRRPSHSGTHSFMAILRRAVPVSKPRLSILPNNGFLCDYFALLSDLHGPC